MQSNNKHTDHIKNSDFQIRKSNNCSEPHISNNLTIENLRVLIIIVLAKFQLNQMSHQEKQNKQTRPNHCKSSKGLTTFTGIDVVINSTTSFFILKF